MNAAKFLVDCDVLTKFQLCVSFMSYIQILYIVCNKILSRLIEWSDVRAFLPCILNTFTLASGIDASPCNYSKYNNMKLFALNIIG